MKAKKINQEFKISTLIFFLLCFNQILFGQNTITSSVITANGGPLCGASVVLLNPVDSVVTKGTITNEQGDFNFNNVGNKFLLYVSFIGYQTKIISSTNWLKDQTPVLLEESENQLQEVKIIKARNAIKIEANKIVFTTEGLAETRAATNAFALLDYVPGLLVQNDQVSVVGASSVTVVINNKITNMSLDQVFYFLKSTPSDQVKNIEYYFVAPKRFNVHGALINVDLKQGIEKGKCSGSISGDYQRGREDSYNGNLNFSLTKGKFDFQAVLNKESVKKEDRQTISTHLKSDMDGELSQFITTNSDKKQLLYSLNPRFNINDSSYVDVLYSFIPKTSKATTGSNVNLNLSSQSQNLSSNNYSRGESDYHNLALSYSSKNMNAGFVFINYEDPTNQKVYTLDKISNEESLFTSESKQDIQQLNAFINNTTKIIKGDASLEYGLSYKDISNKSRNNEFENSNLAHSRFKLKENRANGYLSLNYQLSPKLSSIFAIELEYDKLEFSDLVKQSNIDVIDDFFIFPTIDLTYVASNNHIFKANFTSFSKYPGFWDLTPNTWTLTPFANVVGNPSLKPQRNYNTQLIYIFKGKYILVFSGDMYQDWITQVPFNGEDGYSITYKSINIDKNYTGSMAFVIPFSPINLVSSKFTASLSRNIQKDSSHEDYKIDKTNVNYYFGLNNSITISKEREIFADLNGYYASGRPQGFYDLKESFCFDASFRVKVLKNASLLLSCKDIFRSKTPKATTEFEEQYNHFDFNFDTRQFKIGFVYNFGEKIKMRKDDSELEPSERFMRN